MIQKEINDITNLYNTLYNKRKQIIAIAGLSKNAGKTSFLNFITQAVPQSFTYALTTTGHDGEDHDFLTGLKKPKVSIKKGNYYTSIPSASNHLSLSVKTIKKLEFHVRSENLFLYQALDDLEVEIYGASHVFDQEDLCRQLLHEEIDFVFIDGSLDRKSIALSPIINHFIVLGSASFGRIDLIENEFQRILMLSQIDNLKHKMINELSQNIAYQIDNKIYQTQYKTLFNNEREMIEIINHNPDFLYIPSALTDAIYQKLKSALVVYQGILVFQHPLKILISCDHLFQLQSKTLKVIHKLPLTAFAINSYSVESNHLDCDLLYQRIKKKFTNIPLIDIQNSLFKE